MKTTPLDPAVVARIGDALGVVNFAAFRTGVEDGHEQGFELSMGMSYDDLDHQWEYDIGTHIGASLAVRPVDAPILSPAAAKFIDGAPIPPGYTEQVSQLIRGAVDAEEHIGIEALDDYAEEQRRKESNREDKA